MAADQHRGTAGASPNPGSAFEQDYRAYLTATKKAWADVDIDSVISNIASGGPSIAGWNCAGSVGSAGTFGTGGGTVGTVFTLGTYGCYEISGGGDANIWFSRQRGYDRQCADFGIGEHSREFGYRSLLGLCWHRWVSRLIECCSTTGIWRIIRPALSVLGPSGI